MVHVQFGCQQWPTFPDLKFVFNTAAKNCLEKIKYTSLRNVDTAVFIFSFLYLIPPIDSGQEIFPIFLLLPAEHSFVAHHSITYCHLQRLTLI